MHDVTYLGRLGALSVFEMEFCEPIRAGTDHVCDQKYVHFIVSDFVSIYQYSVFEMEFCEPIRAGTYVCLCLHMCIFVYVYE
jgi:acyl-CoA hydrolase